MLSQFDENPEIALRFPELHPPFQAQAAVVEANRCLNCFDAPCTGACPTHIDVPRFIKKIASGNLRGSALTILDANILGASCSRVCPVEVLCEGACVMHHHNRQPIEIARLQRFPMDAFHRSGGRLPRRNSEERKERVACLGAGPASLACAAELRQQGFQVTVFEKRELPGGLNTYGVAEYKLRTADSLREIELVEDLGVAFRLGVDVCGQEALDVLERDFDVIFLGVGLGAMHRLNLPGGDHAGVVDALEFIAGYKTGARTSVPAQVVVIGAGNTAIDAANAAKRLGASEVTIVYRRTEPHISAFDFEYEHAKQEGVRFLWLTQPVSVRYEGDDLRTLVCERVELAGGALQPVPGSELEIACGMVIPAIGQSPLLGLLEKLRGVEVRDGRVVVNPRSGQTANPKYFAGGDCVNGGREVVDAVAEGKRAGIAIARALEVSHA